MNDDCRNKWRTGRRHPDSDQCFRERVGRPNATKTAWYAGCRWWHSINKTQEETPAKSFQKQENKIGPRLSQNGNPAMSYHDFHPKNGHIGMSPMDKPNKTPKQTPLKLRKQPSPKGTQLAISHRHLHQIPISIGNSGLSIPEAMPTSSLTNQSNWRNNKISSSVGWGRSVYLSDRFKSLAGATQPQHPVL